MKRNVDWKDFTIRWNGHQKFVEGKLFENDIMEVIIQKLEMILFTNETEIYGKGYNLGVDLEYYLWETQINNDIIKGKIVQQINEYIPELNLIGYDIDLQISEGTIRDIMNINIQVKGYNLSFIFA